MRGTKRKEPEPAPAPIAPTVAKKPKMKEKVLPSSIANKSKRTMVYAEAKKEKKKEGRLARKQRKSDRETYGKDAVATTPQKTIDNTRELDETMVASDDEEVKNDEALDEFSTYFNSEDGHTRNMLTTCIKPSAGVFTFMKEFVQVFPNTHYYKRGTYEIKKICEYAAKHRFTNLIVLNEDKRKKKLCNILLTHLPNGPTADFKISSIKYNKEIKNHGTMSDHLPELVLNNFNTRLGHRVGRFLASLFPPKPDFNGRRVITFHNQRDFLFFRHHRYIFDNAKKARLQELGPRFTLKLRSLQNGTFDSIGGEYEWLHKADMDTSRRRFFL